MYTNITSCVFFKCEYIFIRKSVGGNNAIFESYAIVDIIGEVGTQQSNSRSRQLNDFKIFLISTTESNIFSAI